MSQPCSNPSATTSTARSGTAVLRGAGLGVGSGASDAVLVAVRRDLADRVVARAGGQGRAGDERDARRARRHTGCSCPSLTRRGRPWRVRSRRPALARSARYSAIRHPRPLGLRRIPSAAHRSRTSSMSGTGRSPDELRDAPPRDVRAVEPHDRADLPRADADERREVAVGHDAPARHLLHGPQHPLHDDVVHGPSLPDALSERPPCWSRPHHGPTLAPRAPPRGRERRRSPW